MASFVKFKEWGIMIWTLGWYFGTILARINFTIQEGISQTLISET